MALLRADALAAVRLPDPQSAADSVERYRVGQSGSPCGLTVAGQRRIFTDFPRPYKPQCKANMTLVTPPNQR